MCLKPFKIITGRGRRRFGGAREMRPVQEGKGKHMASNIILLCQHYEPGICFFAH